MSQRLFVAFIQNAGLLLSLVFVFDFFARRGLTRMRQTIAGFAVGMMGIAIIGSAIPLHSGTIFDTRSVLLALSGLFLGGIPTAIGMAMTAAYRIALGGADFTGVAVIVASGLIGLTWRRLRAAALVDVTWQELYGLGLLVHTVMLALMFTMPPDVAWRVVTELFWPVMTVHPLATMAIGVLFTHSLRHHRTATELRTSETRFRLLAENARDMIFRLELEPERHWTYVSPSSTRLSGYTPEDFYGGAVSHDVIHPDDRALIAAVERGETGEGAPVMFRFQRRDGEMFWAEQRNTFIRDANGAVVALEGIVRDVTQTKQADAMIRLALKAANQGFYDVNLQTGATRVSDEFVRMLGLEPDGYVETHESWMARLHPDDAARVERAWDDVSAGREQDYRLEFRERTRTGDYIWILSLGSVVSWDAAGRPLRLLGTRTDITALKQAETRTLAAQQLAQSTLDALRQHICVLDEKGTIITVNRAWRDFATANGGEAADLLTGANYLLVCQDATGAEEAQAHEVADALRAVLRGDAETFSLEYPCDSPEQRRWFHLRITRFEGDGPVRVVVAHEDITARRKAEEERLELTAQLYRAQRMESLGGLAGGVAHDINNVLTAILSLASGHRRQVDDGDPLAKSLDTIMSACVRGRSVVRSLLYFASQDLETRGSVDLNGVVREIVELLASTTLRRVDFTVNLDERLPTLTGDPGALSHALMNLCINSLDAMPDGGAVVLTTRSLPDGRVELRVRDSGVGMDASVRERAIEPFFTTKPVGKGTGLGLATVFGTVQAHGGTLDIHSRPGEGTEVVLTFPADAQVSLPPPETRPEDKATTGDVLEVLIIDDDELIADAVAALLEMEGHRVRVALSGAEGLAQIEAGIEVDLVILDMNMPGMNGAETLARLLAVRPDQLVLLCSGHWEESMLRLTDRPTVLSLQKPFTLEEFESKLEALGLRC